MPYLATVVAILVIIFFPIKRLLFFLVWFGLLCIRDGELGWPRASAGMGSGLGVSIWTCRGWSVTHDVGASSSSQPCPSPQHLSTPEGYL